MLRAFGHPAILMRLPGRFPEHPTKPSLLLRAEPKDVAVPSLPASALFLNGPLDFFQG